MTRSKPKDRLSKTFAERRPPPIDPLDLEFPAEAAGDSYVAACLAGLRPARDVLASIALNEALGPAGVRRLRDCAGIAVVVEVPAADWVVHVEIALRGLCDFAHISCRSGAARSLDKPSEGNDKIGRLLSEGARVAGVSQSPSRYLPATLVAAADLYVRIGPITNRTIAHAIRAATGKRPRRMPRAVAATLDFDTATACIRLGETPGIAIRRLQAASEARNEGVGSTTGVPALETLYGYGPAMEWCQALVRDLDGWREGRLDWQSISRACLFASEPGLGKTTLARALAKAAGIPLVVTSVADWFTGGSDGYLGGVLRSAENAFQRASSQSPALLFIDECESIPNRATLDNRAREWWTPLINFMLTSLDTTSSEYTSKLIIVGATNHPEQLDAALIRPGRLHPVIHIPRPDAAALAGIFRSHLAEDLVREDLTAVAHLAAGGSGADVAAWVRQARSTARAQARRMTIADLAQAVAPPDERSPEELQVVARHESAHAAAATLLGCATVRSVSIAATRSTAGSTITKLNWTGILTRAQSEAIVVMALVGRAMDALCGDPHSGAGGGGGSDLARATAALAMMHASYGLGDSLICRGGPEEIGRAVATDPVLRGVIERDLQRLYARSCAFVREHRTVIEAIAERLLERRVLSGDEIAAIVAAWRRPIRPVVTGGHDA